MRFKLAIVACLLTSPVWASDLAPSYGVPGYPASSSRAPAMVALCPSSDGSNSVVACGSSASPTTTNDGGTATTASTMPPGGSGLTGWQSAIYTWLSTLGSTAANQATEITSLSTLATASASAAKDGIDGTSITPPTGASGIRGWLSGSYSVLGQIYTKLTGSLAVTGAFYQATQPISAVTLPLPTGATTLANQNSEVSSLSSIVTNTANNATATAQATGNTSLATIAARASPLAYTTSGTATVTTTSGTLITGGAYTKSLTIQTAPTSTGNVWLNITGGTAVAGSGVLLAAGGGGFIFGGQSTPLPTSVISAVSDGGVSVVISFVGG